MKNALLSIFAASLLALSLSPAMAESYMYKAKCSDSYWKFGAQSADLTKVHGHPISCDTVIIFVADNGHAVMQFVDKAEGTPPLGFAGDGLDYDSDPKFITLPVQRIYLQHGGDQNKSEMVSGVQGVCFIDGSANVRTLNAVSCASKIDIGDQKFIYHIDASILSVGAPVPGM